MLSLADISGQGVGIWTNYEENHEITVIFPDGEVCSGPSFKVSSAGTYLVTIKPNPNSTSARVWQGEIRDGQPFCQN